MPDVTLVLNDWSLEQFWLEVSSALGDKEVKSQEYAGETLDKGIEASNNNNIEYEEIGMENENVYIEVDGIQDWIKESGNKTDHHDSDHKNEEQPFNSGLSMEVEKVVYTAKNQEHKNKISMEEKKNSREFRRLEDQDWVKKTGTGTNDDDDHNDEEERFASGISMEVDMLVHAVIKEIDTKNRVEHQANPEAYFDEDKTSINYENNVKSEPDVKATRDETKYPHDYFEDSFPGNNNSPVSMKPPLNLCAKVKQDPKEKTPKYKCEVCAQNFKTEIKLAIHMQFYHKVDKVVKCQFKGCKVESINIKQSKAHIEQSHVERVPCDVCGKSVRTTSFKAHQQTHVTSKERVPCDLCGKSVRTTSLKAHQQTHVTSNKTFPCEVCDYKTSLRGNLDIHMKKHSDKKNYQCTNCEKKFTWCSSLKSHMLAAHSKKSHKFKCEICTHEFKDGSNLAQHMFTHRVERPHNCNKCGKGWIRADFLKNHKCSAL